MIKGLLLHVTRVISAGWCAECLLGGASRTTQQTLHPPPSRNNPRDMQQHSFNESF
jgi:hypothetical protein